MNSFTQLNWVLTLLIQCFFCQGYFFLPWFPSSPAQKSVFALCSVPFLCRLLPDNCTQSICGGANTTTAQLEAPMKMDSFVNRTSNSSKPSSLRYRVIWFGRCVWIEGSATPRRRDSASERENLLAPLQIDHAFEGWTKTAEVTGTEAADTQADGSPFDPFALIQFRRQRDQANATRWPHHHWTGSSFIEGFRVLSFAFERERERTKTGVELVQPASFGSSVLERSTSLWKRNEWLWAFFHVAKFVGGFVGLFFFLRKRQTRLVPRSAGPSFPAPATTLKKKMFLLWLINVFYWAFIVFGAPQA